VYGQTPVLLGLQEGMETAQIVLGPKEHIRQMQVKSGK
jgi:hypothetical protein